MDSFQPPSHTSIILLILRVRFTNNNLRLSPAVSLWGSLQVMNETNTSLLSCFCC